MTYWQQPWGRFELCGRECRLQVLDPATAFAIEPEIIAHVRPELLMSIAGPVDVLDGIGKAATGGLGWHVTLAQALLDPEVSIEAAAAGLRVLGRLTSSLLAAVPSDGAWVAQAFTRVVLDRIEVGPGVDDEPEATPKTAATWRQWAALKLPMRARWACLVAQLAQSFGPLWTRSPYSPSSRTPRDYGVPLPPSPLAVQWAGQLASLGYAAGTDEVLRFWTPEQLIQAVELAAHQAELHHRASEAARTEGTG